MRSVLGAVAGPQLCCALDNLYIYIYIYIFFFFLARIDQQANIYHSSLSKQDSTQEKQNKQQQQKKTKRNYILNIVFSRKSISLEIKISG